MFYCLAVRQRSSQRNTLFMRAVLEGVRKVSPEFFQQKINVCVGVHVIGIGDRSDKIEEVEG